MILWADISNFMTWFLTEVLRIFTFCWDKLNDLEFGGTSLLKVIIFINVIVPLLYVVITVVQTGDTGIRAAEKYNMRVQKRNEKARRKAG